MSKQKKKLVKKKPEVKKNAFFNKDHPDIAHRVEFAFECAGVKYYRMGKDSQGNSQEFLLPAARYIWIDTYFNEVDNRMTFPVLKGYVEKLKTILNGQQRLEINMGEAWKIIHAMESRMELIFDPATVERLAAVVYFDETEDLRSFDPLYGEKKIEFWKKNDLVTFFLTRPIAELLGLNDSLEGPLRKYIREANEAKNLILEHEKSSPPSS